jgi:hypothetical protein
MDVDIPEQKDEATIEEKEVVQKEEPTVREVVEEKPAHLAGADPVVKEEPKEVKEELKEEKKEEELEQYSEGVQKRIAKLTKKWREAERQKDEAITYAERMIVAKNRTDAKISKLEPSYLSVSEERITSGIEAAKAKLAAAREANDLGAEADALANISELGVKKAQLTETKAAQEEYNKQQSTQKAPSLARSLAAKGTPDPKAEAWAEKNSWFGQNNAMTYTAMDLHKTLTEKEGFDSSSDEYYAEINKRIRLEFPHKFDRTTLAEGTTKPVQTVASAKRSTKTGRKTVRLTPSQVTIAKKLGVPLEEYAKQLNITKES